MTRYIVSGYIGFDNFGDEAIAKVLTDSLKRNGADKITLISSNPKKTSELHHVESCSMLNFINPLLNSDVLISGGGSLLQDVTSFKSLIYYLSVIYIALIFRKKVEIYAQGIGPIRSKIGRFLTKTALKHAEKISVRDEKSQQLLSEWNIKSELVKDPLFLIDLPHKEHKKIVGVQLRDFPGISQKFLEKLACEIASRFGEKQIIIFSLQDSIDTNICNSFANILRSKGLNNTEILTNLSTDKVFEKFSELEYLIAMRFHANVVGIKSGVKTLAINYDPKVKKLADEYNLPLINLDDTNFSDAFNKLVLS